MTLDEIKRHEWVDHETGGRHVVTDHSIYSNPFEVARCREILRLANENFKLKCDLLANQGYGDGLATLCEQNRERAEKAERELAEARAERGEPARSAGPDGLGESAVKQDETARSKS